MSRNILILEDNKNHMAALSKLIEDLNRDVVIHCAHTVKEAYPLTFEHHIHLFLVDIVLNTKEPGDTSGLNFAKRIREVSRYKFTPLIFITSLEDPKYFSYSQLHCYGYIEKPFNPCQVRDMILEALEFPAKEDEDKNIYFQKDGIVFAVCIREIIYIENSRRKIIIHSRDATMEIPYKTCEGILQELDSESFIRCSRYCIVNRKYIEQIDYTNRFIRLKYIDNPVEIGIMMKKSFRQRIDNG